jgi:hypothetical protein
MEEEEVEEKEGYSRQLLLLPLPLLLPLLLSSSHMSPELLTMILEE